MGVLGVLGVVILGSPAGSLAEPSGLWGSPQSADSFALWLMGWAFDKFSIKGISLIPEFLAAHSWGMGCGSGPEGRVRRPPVPGNLASALGCLLDYSMPTLGGKNGPT